jgi:ParB family chromosome partitioning protein
MAQLRELAVSKRDLLMIDPTKLKVKPGYNVRDLSTPDAKSKLAVLAASIAQGWAPNSALTVRLEGDDIYIVAGHRRHAATLLAQKNGAEIKAVPCIAEPKGTTEAERAVDLIISNSGEPLAPLEVATVIKRLIGFGWSHEDIASKLGWESVQTIDNHLVLLSSPQEVQDMVRNGEVSASTAVAVTRKHGQNGAVIALSKAKEEAKKLGKIKVTMSHVKSAGGEFKASPANFKILIDALTKIAAEGDEDDAKIALVALEKIGVIRK